MAGFNLFSFDEPESGHESREPVRPIPTRGDREDETRVIADAWARHAAASGGFADAGLPAEVYSQARRQRWH